MTLQTFVAFTVQKLAGLWKKTAVGREASVTVYRLPEAPSLHTFTRKYDEVQKQLSAIAAMDDLLSGMSSLDVIQCD